MEMCRLTATWSSCVRRQIGSVIVKDKRIMKRATTARRRA